MHSTKWLELMRFITVLDALINLLQVGFVRLSWCRCHCLLPEKCFSSTPDKGSSVERADLKHWMWRCNRASALQSMGASGLVSRARLCCPHGWYNADSWGPCHQGVHRVGLREAVWGAGWGVRTIPEKCSVQFKAVFAEVCGSSVQLCIWSILFCFRDHGAAHCCFGVCSPGWEEGGTRGQHMRCRHWGGRYEESHHGSFVFKAWDESALFCSHFRRGLTSLYSLAWMCGFLPSFCSSCW